MQLPNKSTLIDAASLVHQSIPPTPQFCWPLLAKQLGCEVWVKHENHTCVGAFKVRGGLVYFDDLNRHKQQSGVIAATRGNHGQSIGLAAQRIGLTASVVVPYGNSVEKNMSMQALGVTLIEYGNDFQSAVIHAQKLADERNLVMVPSFHPLLIQGVSSYCLELLSAVPQMKKVYVPIGLGSGICSMAAARNALGHKVEIIGVVSSHATAYADSFRNKSFVESPSSTELADGLACSTPVPEALEIIFKEVSRIVEVTDQEIRQAIRMIYQCTHNVSEGAGAAAVAAAYKDKPINKGQCVGVVLTGGNVDKAIFAEVLSG